MSMTFAQIREVIDAAEAGKQIQFCHIGPAPSPPWTDCAPSERPVFNFYSYDYRVKPEPPKPREFDVATCLRYGNRWVVAEHPHQRVTAQCSHCIVLHVREVLPNEEQASKD